MENVKANEGTTRMVVTIGLTGGIASGKSTVSKYLSEDLGFIVLDADTAARKVVEKGENAYKDIISYFGEEILNNDGTINREKLGSIIFNDNEKRQKLNSIVHPAVRDWMNEQKEKYIKEGAEVIIEDIPLLFENSLQDNFQYTLLVYVDHDMQIKRLMERNNFSKDEAKARIESQMPLKQKIAMADAVINNNGTIDQTYKQVREILINWKIL